MNITGDDEVSKIIKSEFHRQKDGLELIASENFTSQNVLDALGSIMTNKYSEGQPGKRYYGGNEHIDEMEHLCKHRALDLYKLNKDEIDILNKLLKELYVLAEPTRIKGYSDEQMFEANAVNEFTVSIAREIQAEIIANGRPSPAKIRNAMGKYTVP